MWGRIHIELRNIVLVYQKQHLIGTELVVFSPVAVSPLPRSAATFVSQLPVSYQLLLRFPHE